MKVVLPEKYRPKRTTKNEHSENSFCVCFHGSKCFKIRLYIRSFNRNGFFKIKGTIRELRAFRGDKISMHFAHKRYGTAAIQWQRQRLLQFCSWDSGLAEGAGMITADKPNKGVEDEGWSEVTGAGAPEGEVKVCFEDSTCVEHDGFSDHWASTCFPDAQTRLQVTA